MTQEIVAICLKSAAGKKVQTVTVQIGSLSGFVPEAVEFCFAACCKETPLEGAQLVIERIPAMANCKICNSTFEVSNTYDPCPQCSSQAVIMVSGSELRVKELEVED